MFSGAETGAHLCNRWTVVSCHLSQKFEDEEKLAFEERYSEGPASSGGVFMTSCQGIERCGWALSGTAFWV